MLLNPVYLNSRARTLLCGLLLLSLFGGLSAKPVQARQTAVYSVALRGVALNEALAEFSNLSGAGVTFDPAMIDRKQVYCVVEKASADDVLKCLLSGTGLDYVQLSSGTYVITAARERPALYATLTGVVRDRQTGRPLPNAHVVLASISDEIGAVTNPNGQFVLPPLLPGMYLVSATYVGYRDRTDTLFIQPGSHRFSRIDLLEEPIIFTPLVIDGLQRERPSEELDRSMLLRTDQLKPGVATTGESIFQQLTSLPGVRVNDLTADAHLQGSDTGEHQFRLDGVPIFLPQSAIGIIGPFSPFAIQSLTVHRSGFGVQEGSYLAGVVDAAHKLEGPGAFDIQFDLMSLNARALVEKSWNDSRRFNLMIAGRSSLWDVYQQPRFQETLNDWSKPDPFIIFAPSRRYTEIDPSFFQSVLNVSAVPHTDLSFADLHVATRYNFNMVSALRASFYTGRNQFGGSLLRDLLKAEARYQFNREPELALSPANPAPLSLVDDYTWQNEAAQVAYHTIFGHHTLFNIQGRASRYTLDQQYRVIDNLAQYIEDLTPPADTNVPPEGIISIDIPTMELNDTNTIEEYALESRIEYARNQHLLTLGFESTYHTSRFNLLLPSLTSLPTASLDSTTLSDVEMERVQFPSKAFRHAMYAEDRLELGDFGIAELGVRLTYIPERQTIYAEPRAALRFEGALGSSGSFALRTAGGVYRQYLLQFDISTLNAGALFPSKRIWLPVDNQTRPPLAYHLSQSVLIEPLDAFSLRLEGYAKFQQHAWTMTYIERSDPASRGNLSVLNSLDSPQFLAPSHGRILGFSASIDWESDGVFFQSMYDFSSIRRRSEALFNDTWTSVPWTEPHRFTTSMEWLPIKGLILSSRFTGVWGRSWGFRQAYYDFFGHKETTRYQPPYDFGNPDAHVLPPLYQLDLGLAYQIAVGSTEAQFRFDLLNALDRKNVIDWRLVWVNDMLKREARYLYGRIPSLSLRFSW